MSPDGPDKAVDPVLVNTLVYNQDERSQRFMTSMRCAVLSAFNTYLPEVVEVSDGEAEHFEQVLQRLDTAIDEQGTELAQFIREASDETIGDILHSCVAEVTSVIDTADDETEVPSLHAQLQQALEQVRENLLALRENFNLDVFGDDRMLTSLESAGDRDTDAPLGSHAFVERRKRQPALSFDGEVEPERNLWEEAVQSTQASSRPEEQMPDPFRWSWTDEELFAEIKMPKVMIIAYLSDVEEKSLWDRFITDLKEGADKWKSAAKTRIPPKRRYRDGPSIVTRDQALNDATQRLIDTAEERRRVKMFDVVRGGIFSSKSLGECLDEMSEKFAILIQMDDAPRPVFIRSALRKLLTGLFNIQPAKCYENISSDHIATHDSCHKIIPPDQINFEKIIGVCVGKSLVRPDLSDPQASVLDYVKKNCKRKKMQMHGMYDQIEEAIQELALLLKGIASSIPEELSIATSVDLVCLLKKWMQKMLESIATYENENLPEYVMADIRNGMSHYVCWHVRYHAIKEPTRVGMNVESAEYVRHMDDFYSLPIGTPLNSAVNSGEGTPPLLSMESVELWWKNVWGDFQDRHALHDVVDANVEVVTTATSTVGTMVRDSVGRWEEESALESVASFETQLNILHQYLVEPGRFPSECTVEGATVELPVEDWKQYFAHQLEDMETQVRPVIAEREYVLTRRRLLSVEPCVETHLDATRSEMETMTAELTGYEGELTTGVSTTDIPFEDVDSLHEYAEGIAELACTVIQQNGDAESVSGSETIEGIFRPFFVAFQTTQEAYTSRETVLIDACKAQAEVLKLRHDNSEDQESIAELEGRLQSANEDNPYEALCSVQSHVRHISSVLEAIAQQQ